MKAISDICTENGLDYVIDTGKGAYLYINPEKGVDISEAVNRILGIENEPEIVVEGGQPVINRDSN